jgi:hypothetical protein
MKRSVRVILTLLATALVSSTALAQINFRDNFENYPVYQGENPWNDIGNGWLFFTNVYGNFPGCTDRWYGYGGAAPNGPQISNIVDGYTGHALNTYSDYNNGNHGDSACLETNVLQERVVTSSDYGTYTFRFVTQVPMELGVDVETFGFIKLLDPNNGWSMDLFYDIPTETPGVKTLGVRLGPSEVGKVLQWGFANLASNYEASGRHYDNVTFAISGSGAYEGDSIGVPVPLWAYFIIAGLLAFVGGTKLLSRKET